MIRVKPTGTILNGTRFDDLLIGTDDNDVLRGGAGNDVLIGGRGNDVIQGQDGDDLMVWNSGDGSDAMEGGAGFDFVQVNGANGAGDDFLLGMRDDRIVLRDQNSGDELSIASTEVIEINGMDGDDAIVSTLGADSGVGLRINGGWGNDLLMAGDTADVIHGGFGNDWLAGGQGDDNLYGDEGDDLIVWNAGDGNDHIEGGDGDDTVLINGSELGETILIAGGEDDAAVEFQRGNLKLFTLDIGTTENLDVDAGGGDDMIIGAEGLAGRIALDLDGGAGNDLLIGGDGADVLRGGAGNDVLLGGRGNDIMLGQDGNDLMIVNDGDGSDFIEGGDGDDTVRINGLELGETILIDPAGDGVEVQFQRNNLGLFTLDIGTTENLDVNGQGGSDVIIGSTGLQGLISLDLDGGAGDDFIAGGDGDDLIHGGADADVLLGRDGNDAIFGDQGNDWIVGGTGNDRAYGGDGSDVMVWSSGDGSDRMEGGAGFDFVQVNGSNSAGDSFRINASGERVRMESGGQDPGTLDIGTVEVLDINAGGGDDEIIASTGLAGLVQLDLDGGEGNDLLIGGDGVDVLRGGAGNDVLLGGASGDTMLWLAGDEQGTDRMGDFEFGSDTIAFGDGFLAEGELGEVLVVESTADGTAMLWANTAQAGWAAIVEFETDAATLAQYLDSGELVDIGFTPVVPPDLDLQAIIL